MVMVHAQRQLHRTHTDRGGAGRRGSVLVLVIGVLALMALIVLVYSTIGIADRRGAAALVDKTRAAEQGSAIADYFTQIIGDEKLSLINQTVTAGPNEYRNVTMRKAWTYPGQDPNVVSVPPPNQPWRGFEPSGGVRYTWEPAAPDRLDPRPGVTPFLSSADRAYLDAGTTALNSLSSAITLSSQVQRGGGPFVELYRDLIAISNFADDGRAVSKLAIRGNFDAESGFGVDDDGFLRTSANLWLMDATGFPLVSGPTSPDTAENGILPWVRDGSNNPSPILTDPNVPYMWFMKQYALHRQVGSGFDPGVISVIDQQPGGRFHLDNLFADADGDGFYDSRWFELTTLRGGVRSVVPQYGKMRWFVAAKALDLSGLVNVNTALSFAREPSTAFPAGATPADVDLERLLRLADVRRLFTDASGRESYFSSGWFPNLDAAAAQPSDYRAYDGSGDGAIPDEIGGAAFAALLEARLTQPPVPAQRFAPGDVPLTNLFLVDNPRDTLTARVRSDIWNRFSRSPRGAVAENPFNAGRSDVRNFTTPFSFADELELRSRHGLNDSNNRSLLEVVIDGRARDQTLWNLGPLRSTRGTEYELVDFNGDPRVEAAAHTLSNTSVRSLLTTLSGTMLIQPDPTGRAPVAQTGVDAAGFPILSPLPLSTREVRPEASAVLDAILTGAAGVPGQPIPVDQLFSAYLDALMPDAGSFGTTPFEDVWSPEMANHVLNYGARVTSTGNPRSRVGGNSAEVALRTSATMLTNLIAERSFGLQGGSARPYANDADAMIMGQVLINEDERSFLATGSGGATPQTFPEWKDSGVVAYSSPYRPSLALSLDANRLPGLTTKRLADQQVSGDLSARGGLVLFGVRPQPVLTQAAYFVMYTNAPIIGTSGGPNWRDKEWTDSGVPNVPPTPGPATIFGSVDAANDDFVFEMFAVQLTNPFDRAIALTSTTPDGKPEVGPIDPSVMRYYIEFNNRFYKLVDKGPEGAENNGVELLPGESRVFYYTTLSPQEIADRMNAVMPTSDMSSDRVIAMIEGQIKTRVADASLSPSHGGSPVRIVQVDRASGTEVPGTVDLFAGASNSQQRVVRLWRVVHDDTEAGSRNNANVLNDYLVDRLRDPVGVGVGRATLNVQLPAVKTEIAGTSVLPPTPPGSQEDYNNTRFSIMFVGSIRRPDDPRAPGLPRGVMPAYMIEAKSTASGFNTRSFNVDEGLDINGVAIPAGSMDITWFGQYGARRLDGTTGLITKLSVDESAVTPGQVPDQVLMKSLARSASQRSDREIANRPNVIGASGPIPPGLEPFEAIPIPMRALPVQRPLTPMEMLGTLAVSASLDPYLMPASAPASEANLDSAWTTLGEALALGSGYSTSVTPAGTPESYYFAFGHPVDGVVSGGQVRLDTFVPYNDTNNSGAFEQTTGPVGDNRVDSHRGWGTPFAWNIPSGLRFGPLVAQGLININTAPLAVLRVLPLLTPDYRNLSTAGTVPEWMHPTNAQMAGRPFFEPTVDQWDVAAAIKAYRDKTVEYTRGLAGADPVGPAIDFSDTAARVPQYGTLKDYANNLTGRRAVSGFLKGANTNSATGLPLREYPGFMSIMEVLGARIAPGFTYTGPYTVDRPNTDATRAGHSIDRLGRFGEMSGGTLLPSERVLDVRLPSTGNRAGLTPNWVEDPNSAASAGAPAEIPDGRDAQLAIAAALMNTTTVRSDVFCVWFVIEGYTRADVEGLNYLGSPTGVADPTDDSYATPMIPSVSRRYVMVVDRTNVTAPGQRPKILFLQEVPR